jgi:hypothetical protein
MVTIDGKQIKLQIWDTVSFFLFMRRLVKNHSGQLQEAITEGQPGLYWFMTLPGFI